MAQHARREIAARIAASFRAGTAAGIDGIRSDFRIFTRAWDIDPSDLTVPVRVVHGDRDPVVPVRHAYWYAENLPRVRLRLLRGHHHVTSALVGGRQLLATMQRVRRSGAAMKSKREET